MAFRSGLAAALWMCPLVAAGSLSIDVGVTDRDFSPVPGLTAADFVVRVDGAPRKVLSLREVTATVDLVFLLDVSAEPRMRGFNFLNPVSAAVRAKKPGDGAAVMTFDARPRVLVPFAGSPREVDAGLRALARPGRQIIGKARIYEAIEAAVKLFPAHDTEHPRRRAILVVTHNEEDPVEARSDAMLSLLNQARIVLDGAVAERFDMDMRGRGDPMPPVRLPPPNSGVQTVKRRPRNADRHTIDPIVYGSGGIAVRDPARLDAFVNSALHRLRHSYVLNLNDDPGELRSVTVDFNPAARARHPEAIVHAPRGADAQVSQ